MHKLSRELDALEEDSMKYQVEKNRNKVHRVEKLKVEGQENISASHGCGCKYLTFPSIKSAKPFFFLFLGSGR